MQGQAWSCWDSGCQIFGCETEEDDDDDLDIFFLDILGYEVCDGVAIDVDHELKKVVYIEVAMPGDGECLALLAVLEADSARCVIAGC